MVSNSLYFTFQTHDIHASPHTSVHPDIHVIPPPPLHLHPHPTPTPHSSRHVNNVLYVCLCALNV